MRTLCLSLAVIGLNACTLIGGSEESEKTNCLDKDSDGVPWRSCSNADYVDASQLDLPADCNDDPAVGEHETPGQEEIPYDGWDNDCSPANDRGNEGAPDIVDIDGDGYPGISYNDYVQNIADSYGGIEPPHAWPSNVKRDAIDCDDTNAAIHPGAEETDYDGVDQNCDNKDDFDQDGDLYYPTEYESAYAAYGGTLQPGDCNDGDSAIYPGAPNDRFYDGVDTNCDKSSDYDQDSDGFIRFSDLANCLDYKTRNDIQASICELGPENTMGDCNDDNPAYYPGAPDSAYDGLDTNCDELDDFDQDQDSYIPDDHWGDYSSWPDCDAVTTADCFDPGANAGLPKGDCDDNDKLIHPGQTEVIGDATDQDCDGGDDTTPFVNGYFQLENPMPPRLAVNNQHFLLALSADSVGLGGGNQQADYWAVFPFNLDSGYGADLIRGKHVRDSTNTGVKGAINLVGQGDSFWVGFGRPQSTTVHKQYIDKFDHTTTSSSRIYNRVGKVSRTFTLTPQTQTPLPLLGMDVRIDLNGQVYSGSCDGYNGYFMSAPLDLPSAAPTSTGLADVQADLCWLSFRGAKNYLDSVDQLTHNAAIIDEVNESLSPAEPPTPYSQILSASSHGDYIVYARGTLGATIANETERFSHLTDLEVLSADAVIVNSTLYLAAVVTAADPAKREIIFAYGVPGEPLTRSTLPLSIDPLLAQDQLPQHITLEASGDRVAIAVSSISENPPAPPAPTTKVPFPVSAADTVSWLFMQH